MADVGELLRVAIEKGRLTHLSIMALHRVSTKTPVWSVSYRDVDSPGIRVAEGADPMALLTSVLTPKRRPRTPLEDLDADPVPVRRSRSTDDL